MKPSPDFATMPLDPVAWAQCTADLTLEEQGAFLRLALAAWTGTDAPPSLDADPWMLAAHSGLRDRWAKHGDALRALLVPVPGQPGRVAPALLLELHDRISARVALRREAGRAGGRPRTRPAKPPVQQCVTAGSALLHENETNGSASKTNGSSKKTDGLQIQTGGFPSVTAGSPNETDGSPPVSAAKNATPPLSARTGEATPRGRGTPPLKGVSPPPLAPAASDSRPDWRTALQSPVPVGAVTGRLFDTAPLPPLSNPPR